MKTAEEMLVERVHNDIVGAVSTESGRRFVFRVLQMTGFQAPIGPVPEAAWYNGRASVGGDLLKEIEIHAPGSFILMQQEALRDAQLSATAAQRSGEDGGSSGRGTEWDAD